MTRGYAFGDALNMTTENTSTHTIVIPLGVADARARVHQDGTVRLLGHRSHPLPRKLATTAWAVLSTWMIEQDSDDPVSGQTMVDPSMWREMFGQRARCSAPDLDRSGRGASDSLHRLEPAAA